MVGGRPGMAVVALPGQAQREPAGGVPARAQAVRGAGLLPVQRQVRGDAPAVTGGVPGVTEAGIQARGLLRCPVRPVPQSLRPQLADAALCLPQARGQAQHEAAPVAAGAPLGRAGQAPFPVAAPPDEGAGLPAQGEGAAGVVQGAARLQPQAAGAGAAVVAQAELQGRGEGRIVAQAPDVPGIQGQAQAVGAGGVGSRSPGLVARASALRPRRRASVSNSRPARPPPRVWVVTSSLWGSPVVGVWTVAVCTMAVRTGELGTDFKSVPG